MFHFSLLRCLLSFSVPILCAYGELGEQAYETAIYIYDICSGVRAIRFLGSVFATARFFLVTADVFFLGSSTSRWTFEGRHYVHLPAPTVVRDFEQLTMSGTGATGALSMGPSAWYIFILKLVKFNLFLLCMLFMNIFAANLSCSKITHVHIFVITNLLLFFWINFNVKMPKFL